MSEQEEKKPRFDGVEDAHSNFFMLPHQWIDLCAEIDSLAELKVVQYVLRHTWGFQEYDDTPKHITVDEFMYGRMRRDGTRIDKGTGLSRQGVKDGIERAIKDGLLICEVDDRDRARIQKSYAINRKHVQKEEEEAQPSRAKTLPSGELNNRGLKRSPRRQKFSPRRQEFSPLEQEFSPRTEKETKERNLKKETEERESATISAPSTLATPAPSASLSSSASSSSFVSSEKTAVQVHNGTKKPRSTTQPTFTLPEAAALHTAWLAHYGPYGNNHFDDKAFNWIAEQDSNTFEDLQLVYEFLAKKKPGEPPSPQDVSKNWRYLKELRKKQEQPRSRPPTRGFTGSLSDYDDLFASTMQQFGTMHR